MTNNQKLEEENMKQSKEMEELKGILREFRGNGIDSYPIFENDVENIIDHVQDNFIPKSEVEKLFNIKELKKKWEETFYESDWNCDTLKYSKIEKSILEELTTFLPRHMPPYDWNLPFADEIILIFRRHLNDKLTSLLKK